MDKVVPYFPLFSFDFSSILLTWGYSTAQHFLLLSFYNIFIFSISLSACLVFHVIAFLIQHPTHLSYSTLSFPLKLMCFPSSHHVTFNITLFSLVVCLGWIIGFQVVNYKNYLEHYVHEYIVCILFSMMQKALLKWNESIFTFRLSCTFPSFRFPSVKSCHVMSVVRVRYFICIRMQAQKTYKQKHAS